MIRIIHVVEDFLKYGGGEHFYRDLIPWLHENDVRIIATCFKKYCDFPLDSQPFPILHLDDWRVQSLARQADVLLWWGRIEESIDRFTQIPCRIAFVHGDLNINYMLRYAIEKSTCAICVSRLSAEKIRCCRSRVILPGINPASIICSEERNSTRQSLGLSLHDFVVGQFVRAHTFKNTEMLISALPEDLVCKILFVGDGPHLKQILSIADKKIPGRFIHVQHNQMHLGKLYSAIDCYACTSISEGCPRVMWESMFSRKPFLTTPVGACVDVIKHGYNGFVFSNCDELKSTILLLKSNSVLRGNIANAAFAMANAHGHIQKTASEIASFIKKEIYYKCLT